MKLDHKSQLSVFQKIVNNTLGYFGTVAQVSDCGIASATKQPSDLLGLMVVVNMQPRTLARLRMATDRAKTLLGRIHSFKFFPSKTILVFNSPYPPLRVVRLSALRKSGVLSVSRLSFVFVFTRILTAISFVYSYSIFWQFSVFTISLSAFRGIITRLVGVIDTFLTPRRSAHWTAFAGMKFFSRLRLIALRTSCLLYTRIGHEVHVSLTRFVNFVVRLVGLQPFEPSCILT